MLAKRWRQSRQALRAALRPWRLHLAIGVTAFAALTAGAVAAAVYAGRPAAPEITIWCEWFVAVLALPAFVLSALGRRTEIQSWLRRRLGDEGRESDEALSARIRHRRSLQHLAAVLLVWGGTVFALDLLLRALLGLGLDPF